MQALKDLRSEISRKENREKADFLKKFFKTGDGQYGQGDQFAGLTVPESRHIARAFHDLSFEELEQLLASSIHEERLISLLILVDKFSGAKENEKRKIYEFYLTHTDRVNNWDLVDLSSDKIVGVFMFDHPSQQKRLKTLAKSKSLWERRIAMIATYYFIKNGDPKPTLEIADILLFDKHDLIQKAVGWMLREVGKRCGEDVLITFLHERYNTMPRTALRYAIERFPQEKRLQYLQGTA